MKIKQIKVVILLHNAIVNPSINNRNMTSLCQFVTILCINVSPILKCVISVLTSKKSIKMLLLDITSNLLAIHLPKANQLYPVTCTNSYLLLRHDLNHMYCIGTLSSPVTNTTHKVHYDHIVFLLYTQTLDCLDETSQT